MKVLGICHHELAGTGVFPEVVTARGHEIEYWLPSEQGLPRSVSEYAAVLAFGGGMNPDDETLHPWLRDVVDALAKCLSASIPTLGVCLGGQLLARAAGAEVRPAPRPEVGWLPIELTDEAMHDPLFTGLPSRFDVFQWHAYEFTVPPAAVLLASSEVSAQCVRLGDCAWGLQWHPEVLAESIFRWATEHPITVAGRCDPLPLQELREQVSQRISGANAAGRDLCARFLQVAEARARTAARPCLHGAVGAANPAAPQRGL